MIDLFLVLITGGHLTPSVLRRFVGPRLFGSSNFWEPVRSYAWPIGLALLTVLVSYVVAFRFFWRRGRRLAWGAIRWREVFLWCLVAGFFVRFRLLLRGRELLSDPLKLSTSKKAWAWKVFGFDRKLSHFRP